MDGQVRSSLLLLQPQARYQRVAVHRVPGLHHTYDVLFLGTSEHLRQGGLGVKGAWLLGRGSGLAQGLSAVPVAGDGRLHKAVGVGPQVHLIEELQIFSPGEPVQNLLLDTDRVSALAACLGCPSGTQLRRELSGSGVPWSMRGGPWGVAVVGVRAKCSCGWWPWLSLRVCAGTAVCCLALGGGPGARGQLQRVPELWGLRPCPRPLLRVERLPLQAHPPLPSRGGLQVRAPEGP